MLWITIYSVALAVMGVLFAEQLPHIYQSVREKVILENKSLEIEEVEEKSHPIISALLFVSVLMVYVLTNNIQLSVFVFVFACLAYTDYVLRWVPDVMIYVMLWISFFSVTKPISEGLLGIVLFCLPALIIYLYSYIRYRVRCIASGDWYVFPSIGLWLSPDTAASYMAVCIILVFIISRYTRDVPLLTCLFPVFVGGQLCELYFAF
ncbi:A24 family peptidase [Enterobacter ludwigii]